MGYRARPIGRKGIAEVVRPAAQVDFAAMEVKLMAMLAHKPLVLCWHMHGMTRTCWVPSSLVHNERIAEVRDRDSGCNYSPIMFGGAHAQ